MGGVVMKQMMIMVVIVVEQSRAGRGRAHRDINGRCCRARRRSRCSGCGDASIDAVGCVGHVGDEEFLGLGIDDVDVGAVDPADLVAPLGIGVAGDLHGV